MNTIEYLRHLANQKFIPPAASAGLCEIAAQIAYACSGAALQ